eukprot:gene9427-1634_t
MISYPFKEREYLQTNNLYKHNPFLDEPSPRQGLTSVLYQDKIYLFFGYGGINNEFDDFDDIYEFNITHKVFKKIFQLGDIPTKRAGHTTSIYKDKVILFGGFSGNRRCNDIYEFNFKFSKWTFLNTKLEERPESRSHHSCIIYKDDFYIFGGHIDSLKAPCNKIWKFDLIKKKWSNLSVFGYLPEARSHHSSCLKDDSMIIFGGYNSPNRFNDIYSFNFTTSTWNEIIVNGLKLTKLSEHSATIYHNSMFIFGGFNGNKTSSSLKEFNFSTLRWRKVKLNQKIRRRYLHSTILYENSLIIFAGYDGQELLNGCIEIEFGPFDDMIKIFNLTLLTSLHHQFFVDVEVITKN